MPCLLKFYWRNRKDMNMGAAITTEMGKEDRMKSRSGQQRELV